MADLFEEQLSAANLFLQENDLQRAIEHYEEALGLADTPTQKIDLCNALGRLYQKTKNPEQAATLFEKSIVLYDEVSDGDQIADKAAVHNNLGAIYRETNMKRAIENYTIALKIYTAMVTAGDQSFYPHLANTHFALGEAYTKKNDPYFAKKHFKEAITSYSSTTEGGFDDVKAGAHYNLGNIYTEESNLHDAKVNYLKALNFFERLVAADPETFEPYLAAVYNNLGVTFKTMQAPEKALGYYEQALKIYRDLSENSTSRFLPYVAATYSSMGIVSAEIANFEMAIHHMERTAALYNELAEDSPEEYSHYSATTLHNLGLFYLELKKTDKAEMYFLTALEMRKQLALRQPESFNADVCATSLNLVELYQIKMETSLDVALKTKCQVLLEDTDQRLQSYQDDRPVIHTMRSDCRYYTAYFDKITMEQLRVDAAFRKVDALTEEINSTLVPAEKIVFQHQIVNLLEECYQIYPENAKLQNELAYAYSNLSWLQLRTKQFAEAETTLLKARPLEQPIPHLKCNLAHCYVLQDRFEEAKKLYLELMHEKNNHKQPFSKTVIKDITVLRKDGINHTDFDQVLRLYPR